MLLVWIRSQNIISPLPGSKNAEKNVFPLECFNLFMSEDIVKEIVGCTNKFINQLSADYKRSRDCKPTNEKIRNCYRSNFLQIGFLGNLFSDFAINHPWHSSHTYYPKRIKNVTLRYVIYARQWRHFSRNCSKCEKTRHEILFYNSSLTLKGIPSLLRYCYNKWAPEYCEICVMKTPNYLD